MQCLVPLLWQDVEVVAWPALWCFPLTVWQMVQLPLRHTQRWGQRVCWAIGGFLHPHLSLCSIWDMQLGLSTAYSHHCCLAFYTDCWSVCHSILGCWMFPKILFWRHEPVVIKYMYIYFISIIKKEKRTNKKRRGDIHQGLMNAWWHIHYMLASDCDILSIAR